MKTLLIAGATALLLTACSTAPRYEPCPFAGISNVDSAECQATQNINNVKPKAKAIKNPRVTTPSGVYNTCPFAGIDDVAKRSCKAINGVNNIKSDQKVAPFKSKYVGGTKATSKKK